MKQPMINYAKNKKYDHFDTPEYAVMPLLPYINKNWIIWECTDTNKNSEITKVLKAHGNKVIPTSIKDFDFLTDKPDFKFDCIITNPPYSIKDEFIERCYELKKPFAMLLPITALEGIRRGELFRKYYIQVLVLDRRVEFLGKSSWFNSSWFCYKVLPKDLIFAELKK